MISEFLLKDLFFFLFLNKLQFQNLLLFLADELLLWRRNWRLSK